MNDSIATYNKTKEILKEYNIKQFKGMGQNFLIDQNILDKIIDAAELKEDDFVIEIGPGIGSLTQKILNCLISGELIAIEKDNRLMKVLSDLFSSKKNLELINMDVLKVNWKEFIISRGLKGKKIKVIANLPYYITTPIIMSLLEMNGEFAHLVFLVQKEVGERMVASPGGKDYGALSLAVQYYTDAEIIYEVPPTVFIPQPKVYSSIISLRPYIFPPVYLQNKNFFFKIVKAIFQQRRKNIKNSLIKASGIKLNKSIVFEVLNELGIDWRIRGEKLDIKEIAKLSNYLWDKINKKDGEYL